MGYSYDKKTKRYLRSMPWGPHVLADGTRVSTDNVLVIKAKQHYGKIFRGSGHDEPLHDIINANGHVLLLQPRPLRHRHLAQGQGGRSRSSSPSRTEAPFKMAPGQTFVELPDTHAKIRIEA